MKLSRIIEVTFTKPIAQSKPTLLEFFVSALLVLSLYGIVYLVFTHVTITIK